MLKVDKTFNETYQKHKEWACHASIESSIMLYKVLDDELIQIGLSKEITSKIQRLRKSSGISIDDQIEVFYSYARESSSDSLLGQVVAQHTDKIAAQLKMPFLPLSEKEGEPVIIGETEFSPSDKPQEEIKLLICLTCPKFVNERLEADFGSHGADFISGLKSYVLTFNEEHLAS